MTDRTAIVVVVLGALAAACGGVEARRAAPLAPPPATTAPRAPAAPPPAANVPLAVTIDDLPFVGHTAPGEDVGAALGRIVTALGARRVPATGFVVCDRLRGAPDALARWRDAGLALGNHSSSHRAVDELPLDAWSADVRACRDRLEEVDADLAHYPAAVDRLSALGARIVVSGHGDRTDPDQLANTRALAVRAASDR